MVERVIYSTGNFSRKPEYQTRTLAYKNSQGDIKFKKIALDKKAKSHVLNLQKNYTFLNNHGLGNDFIPLSQVSDSEIDISYIKGNDLEYDLVFSLLNGKLDIADTILDRFEELIDKLVVKDKGHRHKDFSTALGPNIFNYFQGSQCIYPGILDLNLDNIIDDKKNIKVIDYEWFFDHCLPYDYVLARTFMWVGSRYRDLFALHSEKLEIIQIADEILLPKFILERYTNIENNIRNSYEIEWKFFQPWVNGEINKKLAKFNTSRSFKTKSLFALDHLEIQTEHIDGLNNHIKELSSLLEKSNQDLERYRKKVRWLKNNPVYKIASKTYHAPRKVIKKNRD